MNRWLKLSEIALGVLVGIQLLILGANALQAQSHPILGLRYQHQDVTFKNSVQIGRLVNDSIKTAEAHPAKVRAGKFQGHITARQLGARYDESAVLQNLQNVGRTGSLWNRVKTQDLALFGQQNQVLGFPQINSKLAGNYLDYIEKAAFQPAANAHFTYQNNQVSIAGDQPMHQLNRPASLQAIRQFDPVSTDVIALPQITTAAPIGTADLKPLLPEAQKLAAEPLQLQAGQQTLVISQEQLVSLIAVTKQPDPNNPKVQKTVLSYDDAKLGATLDKLAAQVNLAPKPKIVSGSSVIDPGQSGLQIDGPHAKIAVIAALINLRRGTTAPAPGGKVNVTIPTEKVDQPVIAKSVATPTPSGHGGTVTLTFDDGPNATYTEPILDILKRYGVKSIFFLIGRNVASYPAITKRISAEGHTIGNHSYTHSDLARLNKVQIDGEIDNTQAIINQVLGFKPALFRPPYGSINQTVRNEVASRNLSVMMWSVDPRDWAEPGAAQIAQRILAGAAPGANILLHVLHRQTVDALPGIIEGLRARGFTFTN